jgi:RHS repeat-associated protein
LTRTTRGPPGSETVLGEYDYNAEGLRVRHRYSDRGDVDYYYDDNAVIEEHNASDDSLLAHYRYADRLISLDTGTSVQYYHQDALGSTVNLTNDAGSTQVSYKLDPWGQIRDQQGTSVNRQIFTQQELDENTGLIYFGARYYDPDTARFITQDSYLGESGIPPSLHRYLYAYSNPTMYIDLYGHDAMDILNGLATGTYNLGHSIFGDDADLEEQMKLGFRHHGKYFTAEEVRILGGDVGQVRNDKGFWDGVFNNRYKKHFEVDLRAWSIKKRFVNAQTALEDLRDAGTLGLYPTGKFIGDYAGAVSLSFDKDEKIRKQAHYDLGQGTPGAIIITVLARAGAKGTTSRGAISEEALAEEILAIGNQKAITIVTQTNAKALTAENIFGETRITVTSGGSWELVSSQSGAQMWVRSEKVVDFYGTESGQLIPSTGYRAIGGPAMEEALSGNIMSNKDTYFGFTNVLNMSQKDVKELFQLMRTPSHVAEFDTLQIINDVEIPAWHWNQWRSDSFIIPEPITKAFPNLGKGGVPQAITNTKIKDFTLHKLKVKD